MKYLNSIKEELSLSELNHRHLNQYIENLVYRLKEYENYMVEDAEKLKTIDVKIIFRELKNEFTDEFVKDIKLYSFIFNINEILRQNNKNPKRLITNTFKRYYAYLENLKKEKINQEIKTIKGYEDWDKYTNEK